MADPPSTAPATLPTEEGRGFGTDLGRMIALSDGIFGFAMTLLIVTLAIPVSSGASQYPNIFAYFSKTNIGYSLLAYALGFLVVANWWSLHQRLFGVIVRSDANLLRLNNFLLLCISITPFVMSLVFSYGPSTVLTQSPSAKAAVASFAILEVITGLLIWGIWRYASTGNRLIEPSVSRAAIAEAERQNLERVALFALSAGVAFVLPQIGVWIWAGVVGRIGARKHLLRPKKGGATPAAPAQAKA